MAVSSGFETLAMHLIIKVTQTSYIIGSSAVLLQMDSISLITNIYFLISKRGNAAFFRTCMQQALSQGNPTIHLERSDIL